MGGTSAQTRSERVLEQPNKPPLIEGNTSGSGEGRLEENVKLTDTVPTPHDSPLTGGYTPGNEEGPSVHIEDSPKQGRIIEEMDKDENINVVSEQGEVQETVDPSRDDDDTTLAETLLNIKKSEAKDKGKGIRQENELPKKYHALQNIPFSKAEVRKNMIMYLKNQGGYKQNSFKGMKYEDIRPLFERQTEETEEEVEAQDDSDQEVEELKLYIKIVLDEDIAIEAIPLATKPPVIIEYKIVKEGNIIIYHITRADRSTKRYTSMIKLLKSIDREDLETLWKLVKDKYGNTRPEERYEGVLWGDLKVMFEPDIESEMWRQLQGHEVIV
nr:hypothetical protein [Tanacetum cinerariifolium]